MKREDKEKSARARSRSRAGGSAQVIKASKGGRIANVNQITTDVLQVFANAPVNLASHIRVEEFKQLIDDRTRDFVGRDFIFAAIDNHLKDPDFTSGYIVIQGEPGIGKTSLMAQMVKTRGYVHHFNIAAQNIRSTRDFLSNLCAQLIVRYELDHPTLSPQATQDSGFLSRLLREAREGSENGQIVILVDALDEAEDVGLMPNTNRLYLPPALPTGVFFIVTTREHEDYQLHVDRREDIYIREDTQNKADVVAYIRKFLVTHHTQMSKRVSEWGVDEETFVKVLTELSEGNFMYLIQVLSDIRSGKLSKSNIDSIENLPRGLRDYYQRHWSSMKDKDPEKFERYYQPVVCTLATVRQPVSLSQLKDWTGLPVNRIADVVRDWRSFLNVSRSENGEHLYRIYHLSFVDFLKDKVGLISYHDKISQSALDKIPGFATL
jgi:AAA ATPase-like protein